MALPQWYVDARGGNAPQPAQPQPAAPPTRDPWFNLDAEGRRQSFLTSMLALLAKRRPGVTFDPEKLYPRTWTPPPLPAGVTLPAVGGTTKQGLL